MEKIVLYNDKKECCGCGACMNSCPKAAIHMTEDEYGLLYPQIRKDLLAEKRLSLPILPARLRG